MKFESPYTPKEESNPEFLKKKYQELHSSPEVESATARHKARTGETLQKPTEKIQNYMDRFSEILNREDEGERKRGIRALKKVMNDQLVIKGEDVPERAFVLEQEIVESLGHGRQEITEDFRQKKIEQIREDQEHSLEPWINYLSSPDADYPDWAKYWAFRSMSQMGGYNKEKKAFGKRDENTIASFQTLNAGCLAETIGKLQKHLEISNLPKKDPLRQEKEQELIQILKNDTDSRNILMSENFSKIYANELEKFGGLSWENLENIRGAWKTYKQGSEPDELVESLKGYPLEWCTKNESTARGQLQNGDFLVYYSENGDREVVVPRLAIRMQGNHIGEIRGVEKNQNIDQHIQPVMDEKLEEYGSEGKKYLKKSEDMRVMTEVTRKHRHGEKLSKEDLRFMYEIDGKIEGFGYGSDPRIGELMRERDWKGDMSVVFGTDSDVDLAEKLIDGGRGGSVVRNFDKFEELSAEAASKLIEAGEENSVANNLKKFKGLTAETAYKLIDAGKGESVVNNLDKFEGLDAYDAEKMIIIKKSNDIAYQTDKFKSLELNKTIAEKMITGGWANYVARNIEKFEGLDASIAEKLIGEGEEQCVANNLDKFEGLGVSIAEKLIDKGRSQYVISDVDKFEGLELNKTIAERMIAAGEPNAVAQNLEKFEGLDASIAEKLIDAGEVWYVVNSLIKFEGLELNTTIAERMIAAGEPDAVVNNLDKFEGLDASIAEKLIDEGVFRYAVDHLDKFKNLNYDSLSKQLIKSREYRIFLDNPGKFNNPEFNKTIAEKLIYEHDAWSVARYIDKFEGLDASIAEQLIGEGEAQCVANNLDKFEGLGVSVVRMLREEGFGEMVLDNLNLFEGITPEIIHEIQDL